MSELAAKTYRELFFQKVRIEKSCKTAPTLDFW